MYLGKNIRYLRNKNGYSQDLLAEKLGYKSFTTIQKWESGASEPPIKKLQELSKIFNVDMDDLNNIDLQSRISDRSSDRKKGVVIPVLGHVAAGIPIEAIEDVIDTEEITQEMAATGTFFGLKIKGNSMEPKISDGDIVIVRQQEDAESGDVVIACVNGDEATCKRLRKYKDGIELVSNNPSYEPMFFSNKDIVEKPVAILGRVMELRAKL